MSPKVSRLFPSVLPSSSSAAITILQLQSQSCSLCKPSHALTVSRYKWTTLGSASYNASQLTYVFDTAIVNVTQNATVTKGDLLGMALTGADFAPYCHLEYPTSAQCSEVLLQRGVGQNSWRGLAGRNSILYKRVGKSLKFFANYA